MHSKETLCEKIANKEIKHIIFDLDGTLYSSKSGIEYQIVPLMLKHTSILLSIKIEEAKKLLLKYRIEFKSSVLGLEKYHNVDPTDFYNSIYDEINISVIKLHDGLNNQIKKLSKIVNIHLLTNSNKTHANRVLRKLLIEQYFDNIFSVESANFIRKPNTISYENVVEKIGSIPSEIITIDDSFLNLKTASEIGFHTILVSNGIAEQPMYWEMHTKMIHTAPSYVTASYSNVNDALISLQKFKHKSD